LQRQKIVLVGSIELSEQESSDFSKFDDSINRWEHIRRYLDVREESIEKWIKAHVIEEGAYRVRVQAKPSYLLGPSFPVLVSKMLTSDRD
jgi:hypothetical protein